MSIQNITKHENCDEDEDRDANEEGPYFGYCYYNAKWGWFWGVWEKLSPSNSKPPLLFGFVSSKAMAEDKLNKFSYVRFIDCGFTLGDSYFDRIDDFNDCAREYIKCDWHNTFLNEVERSFCILKNKNKPIWSRCSAGKSKWYWGAWESFYHYINGDDPFVYGYEETSYNSIVEAIKAVDNLKHRGVSPAYAQTYLRKLRVQERQKNVSSNSKHIFEKSFLYTSDFPYHFNVKKKWTRHLILKQTPKYVYVERRPYQKNRQLTNDWYDYEIFSFRLCKEELERDGVVYSRSLHGWFSTLEHRRRYSYNDNSENNQEKYATDTGFNKSHDVSIALKYLGLSAPYTLQELKKTFRTRAFSLHPDQGGKAQSFIQLKKSFDIALRHLSTELNK